MISHSALQSKAAAKLRDMGFYAVCQEITVRSRDAGERRLDVVGINLNLEVRGLEVKVDRADFDRDGKWHHYLEFCTHFGFCAPQGLIDPSELPPKVGLLEYRTWRGALQEPGAEAGYLHWARGCQWLIGRSDHEQVLQHPRRTLVRALVSRLGTVQREAENLRIKAREWREETRRLLTERRKG